MIYFWSTTTWHRQAGARYVVYDDGRWHLGGHCRPHKHGTPEFICTDVGEAEKLRQLIEQRREEREALDRKWELRLAEEVSR